MKPKVPEPKRLHEITKSEKIKISVISGISIVAVGIGIIWYTIWLYMTRAPLSVILSIFLMLGSMVAAIAHLSIKRTGILDELTQKKEKKRLGRRQSIPVKINGKLTMLEK